MNTPDPCTHSPRVAPTLDVDGLVTAELADRPRLRGRPGALIAAVAAMALALAACSSDSGGCKKDTDCASGRICGSDGRCQDARSGSSSGSGGSSGSSSGGQVVDCTKYVRVTEHCVSSADCACGAVCFDVGTGVGPECGYHCSVDGDCASYATMYGIVEPAGDRGTCYTSGIVNFCAF